MRKRQAVTDLQSSGDSRIIKGSTYEKGRTWGCRFLEMIALSVEAANNVRVVDGTNPVQSIV